ncbi:hypothetical protein HK097_010250 [Rhizophlyctis rosea]|uniref:Transmembrane protein n=1 Tax=Rhizophlyctis rosea TaxID=64517 RepID=A0AAD5SB24_9FUNG|nr:hypothetical protein HK097_010250 [Rhizophlyctis rosea]
MSQICSNELNKNLTYMSATVDPITNHIYLAYANSGPASETRVLRITGASEKSSQSRSGTTFSIVSTAYASPAVLALASIPSSAGYDLSLWLMSKTGAITILGGEGSKNAMNVTLRTGETIIDGVIVQSSLYIVGEVRAKSNATTAADGAAFFVQRVDIGRNGHVVRYQFPRGTMKPIGVSKFTWTGRRDLLAFRRRPVIPCGDHIFFLFVSSGMEAGLTVLVYTANDFQLIKRGNTIAGTSTVLSATCLNDDDSGRLLVLVKNGTINMSAKDSETSQYLVTLDAALSPSEPIPLPATATSASGFVNAAVGAIQQSGAVAFLQFTWGTGNSLASTAKAMGSYTVSFASTSFLSNSSAKDEGSKPVPTAECNATSSAASCGTHEAAGTDAANLGAWQKMPEAARVAVVGMPILALIILAVVLAFCLRRRRRRMFVPRRMPEFGSEGGDYKEAVSIVRDSIILKSDPHGPHVGILAPPERSHAGDSVAGSHGTIRISAPPDYSFPRNNVHEASNQSSDTHMKHQPDISPRASFVPSILDIGSPPVAHQPKSSVITSTDQANAEWDPNLTVTRERSVRVGTDAVNEPGLPQVRVTPPPPQQQNLQDEAEADDNSEDDEEDRPLIEVVAALAGAGPNSLPTETPSPCVSSTTLVVPKINGPGTTSSASSSKRQVAPKPRLLDSRRCYDDDYLMQLNKQRKAITALQGSVYQNADVGGKALAAPSSVRSADGSVHSGSSERGRGRPRLGPDGGRKGHSRSQSSPFAGYRDSDVPLAAFVGGDGTLKPPRYPTNFLRPYPTDSLSGRSGGSSSASGSGSHPVSSSTASGSTSSARYPQYPSGTLLAQKKYKPPQQMIAAQPPNAMVGNPFYPAQYGPPVQPEAMIANMQQMWASTARAQMPFGDPMIGVNVGGMYPVGMYPQMGWQAPTTHGMERNGRQFESMHVNLPGHARSETPSSSEGSRTTSRDRRAGGDEHRGRRSRSRESSRSGSSKGSEGKPRSRSRGRGWKGERVPSATMRDEYMKLREKGPAMRILMEGSVSAASGSSGSQDGRGSLDRVPTRGILKQRGVR